MMEYIPCLGLTANIVSLVKAVSRSSLLRNTLHVLNELFGGMTPTRFFSHSIIKTKMEVIGLVAFSASITVYSVQLHRYSTVSFRPAPLTAQNDRILRNSLSHAEKHWPLMTSCGGDERARSL